MNPSFIVHSFLEKIFTKWDAHSLSSSSNQDVFLKNFNADCNTNFFYIFSCAINATCKNSKLLTVLTKVRKKLKRPKST